VGASAAYPRWKEKDEKRARCIVKVACRYASQETYECMEHPSKATIVSNRPFIIKPVFPTTRCRLKMLKMERIKDYLLMEEEFVVNQERLKPQEEKTLEERSKVDELRGTPMSVGTLEEIIDDDHAIISTSNGPEYYVSILSFVDKDLLEPGCAVLLHHKVNTKVNDSLIASKHPVAQTRSQD
jgi:ATP-dependent 26S proteasome regulatory subunit